jgi:hypothetical protein
MSVPHKIQWLLDGGKIQEIEASDADVAALRQKMILSTR